MKTQSKTTGTMQNESLETLFKSELTELYLAQKQLGEVYRKMTEAAQNEELKKVFDAQVQNTNLQVGRIEKCFELLELKPDPRPTDVVAGLAAGAESSIGQFVEGPVRDAAMIAAAQKIEHYGISAYGTLRTMATVMGRVQCARLIEENKDEEAETDEALTRLAMTINQQAFEGS
jgi:ferritin-like metal-binding protein YciE